MKRRTKHKIGSFLMATGVLLTAVFLLSFPFDTILDGKTVFRVGAAGVVSFVLGLLLYFLYPLSPYDKDVEDDLTTKYDIDS